MGGWQTREVDTYTVHSIYMYRVGRAKDGRDQGPGKVKGQRMRKNKKTYLIVKLQQVFYNYWWRLLPSPSHISSIFHFQDLRKILSVFR